MRSYDLQYIITFKPDPWVIKVSKKIKKKKNNLSSVSDSQQQSTFSSSNATSAEKEIKMNSVICATNHFLPHSHNAFIIILDLYRILENATFFHYVLVTI